MSKKTGVVKGGFDEVLAPDSSVCFKEIRMPLKVQVENDLKIPVRVLVKFVQVEDVTSLFVEVAECPSQK